MAVKVFGKDPIRAALEQVAPIFEIKKGYIVDIEEIKKNNFNPDDVEERPIIFYGFDNESSLRRTGHPATPYFYRRDCGYVQAPCLLVEMALLYTQMIKGEKPENLAAILVSNIRHKKNSISTILHDLKYFPGEIGQKAMKKAEAEFGFVGSPEEVQKMLELSKEKNLSGVKSLIGDKVISGVFCDVEGTLVYREKLNQSLVDKLEKLSETKAVSIWTGGDAKEAEKMLYDFGVKKWPVLSKYDFVGCKVETIFDDLSQDKFEEEYQIQTADYRQVARSRP